MGVMGIYRVLRWRRALVTLLAVAALFAPLWMTMGGRMARAAGQRSLYPDLVVETGGPFDPPAHKTVYLTYDDGPSGNTAALLDVLKAEGVPATFFVIGREEAPYPALYRRMAEEGHTVGVHTYSHKYDEIYKSVEGYLADFAKVEGLIYDTTGVHPKIFRFPGGSVNALAPSKTVLRSIVEEITARGYIYYDWNVVSGDDTATVYPPEVLAANVEKAALGKDNVVVLFHDAPLCRTTPEATRLVIQHFRTLGYTFAPLTEAVQPIQFAAARREQTGRK